MTRPVLAATLASIAAAAAIVLLAIFNRGDSDSSGLAVVIEPVTPGNAPVAGPTPLPTTWLDGLHPRPSGKPVLLSCLDNDGNGELTVNDDARFEGMRFVLDPERACIDPTTMADYFAIEPTRLSCDDGAQPVLVVLAGGGGTNLLDPREGESLGLMNVYNRVQTRASEEEIPIEPLIAVAAIAGAAPAQLSMEQYLTAELRRRMTELPCLRVVIAGHSHGGVTVTAATAALEGEFPGRMLGVLIDRSAALYDGDPDAMPALTPILNYYQLNEGWHGVAMEQSNVVNIDESAEYAPLAPSDGAPGLGRVSHKTLDDAPETQGRITDAIVEWLVGGE